MKQRRLVLVGGGHAHALVLRMWAMQPQLDSELVLVSDGSHVPYSGMLPGHIAGIYDFDAMHIDLRRLAQAAGAVYIDDQATGLDLAQRLVLTAGHPPLAYDLLSLNVGSQPDLAAVPGASQWAIPIKPVGPFLKAWQQLLADPRRRRIVLVGGGAGGVELVLAMRDRLGPEATITLVQAAPTLVPSFRAILQRKLLAELAARGIEVILGQRATQVKGGELTLADGRTIAWDGLYWVTEGLGLPWLSSSGLQLDARRSICVESTLEVVAYPGVFAAGDCASVRGQPRPKAGVFAVRQAPLLFANLRRALAGEALREQVLQREFLSLLRLGPGRAALARGPWQAEGRWVWRLKDRIDRRFMQKFAELPAQPMPAMPSATGPAATMAMRCRGCGAKVGAAVLSEVLARISREYPEVVADSRIMWGLAAREDVAAWKVAAGETVLQSIDYFPALLDDPFVMGRIACLHAFSDIIVKGARPHSAMVLAVLRDAAPRLQSEQLYQLLAGVAHELRQMGAQLTGGHSAEGEQLAVGLTVNGTLSRAALPKDGGQAGDLLILSKALGTGLIFAGAMQGLAHGSWIDAAIASMLLSAHALQALLADPDVHAATDVTGFGFLGHLTEMLRKGTLQALLEPFAIPLLPGAYELAGQGVRSSLAVANSSFRAACAPLPAAVDGARTAVWSDPQTAGGFLLSVSPARAAAVLMTLREQGFAQAAVVGELRMRDGEAAAVDFR